MRSMVYKSVSIVFVIAVVMIFMAAQQKEWGQIETMVRGFQDACQKMRYSAIPVVSAPFNLTLGGAAECETPASKR